MAWSYNDIDVFITNTQTVLGELTPNSWVSLSTYGILRGRPSLTLSTLEGDSVTFKMRDGRPMSIDKSRKNAKLEFELLVVDAWPFAERTDTMWDRVNYLSYILNQAKRISYKEPGKNANFYYVIYNTTLTVSDGDERAMTVKVSMDIHPFEYLFIGNYTYLCSGQLLVPNTAPLSRCMPTYSMVGSGELSVYTKVGEDSYILKGTLKAAESLPDWTIVETDTGLAWGVVNGEVVNRTSYFNGDSQNLWIDAGETVLITSTFVDPVRVFTREGYVR